MRFDQLRSSLNKVITGSDIKYQTFYRGHSLHESADGSVWIDRTQTEFSSLEEAREYLEQQQLQEDIQRELQQELYEELTYNRVADIIRKHHDDIRITDTLIESYVELASSKLFTADPVAQDIRRTNTLDRLVEGYVDFKLNDGSVVAISEAAQDRINKVFGRHPDVVEYMRESQEAFLDVLNQLED